MLAHLTVLDILLQRPYLVVAHIQICMHLEKRLQVEGASVGIGYNDYFHRLIPFFFHGKGLSAYNAIEAICQTEQSLRSVCSE